jgi:flagellar protein FliT
MTAASTQPSPPTTSSQQQARLESYERLLDCSGQMLKSAREADWEALIAAQTRYLAEVETLHRCDDQPLSIDPQLGERQAQLLKQVLEQDQEIRQHLNHRRGELAKMIQGSRQQLALSRTYSFYQETAEVIEAGQRFSST